MPNPLHSFDHPTVHLFYNGIFQVLMGIFYYVRSVALTEDLPLSEDADEDINKFYTAAEAAYTKVSVVDIYYKRINSNYKFHFTERIQLLDSSMFVHCHYDSIWTPILCQ